MAGLKTLLLAPLLMPGLGLAFPGLTVGCGARRAATPACPTAAVLRSASDLRAVVPPFPKRYHVVLFRQRPGLVSYHIERGGTLAAAFFIADLGPHDSAEKTGFHAARWRVRGYPAVATAMGSGVAVLVADRFQVELDSLGPSVSDRQRDSWLAAVDFQRLAALAR